MSELESRVEALSDIKHELNFRVQQLEAAHASGSRLPEGSITCGCCLERPARTVVLPCRHLVRAKSRCILLPLLYHDHAGPVLRLLETAYYLSHMSIDYYSTN